MRDEQWENYWKIRELKGEINRLKLEKEKEEYRKKHSGTRKSGKRHYVKLSLILNGIILLFLILVTISLAIHFDTMDFPSFVTNNPLFKFIHSKVGDIIAPIIQVVNLNQLLL